MGIKNERYTEAYARIDSSIETKHFFEAITIEESIISDRLCSFLEATNTLKSDQIYKQLFANLIILWKIVTKNPGTIWEACDELISKVDKWRRQRNKYVHGLVKFPNQKANIQNTEEFLKGAEKTANEGKYLANSVCDWRNRQAQIKRKYNKALKQGAQKTRTF